MYRFSLILALALAATPLTDVNATDCPQRPKCSGCGCKGGPGYRGPDGRCVGFKLLDKVCGTPPETNCTFENAPGTGMNKECALAPKRPRGAATQDVEAEPPNLRDKIPD